MATENIIKQMVFWGVWLIIPLLWEIFAGLLSSLAIGFKYFFKKSSDISHFPKVTVLVPVYNSQKTLEGCMRSIYDQDYPKESMEVLFIDNGSSDGSYEIFKHFQVRHPELRAWWFSSDKGKSKALNKGIFGSTGKYVINIDSDGCLDRKAIKNIVRKFERNERIICMTGIVLVDSAQIEQTEKKLLKAIRICELFEYNESFLIGRNFQSLLNSMYTLAGAFSCFRRETLLKTQMYNSETLGEDTHMTQQMKGFIGGEIAVCEDAFFYVDPVESVDKLYMQRQRWQRAELEVASMFKKRHMGGIVDFILKPDMRKLVSDHTLAFPKLIWIFAMIYLYFINYPLSLLVGANVLLYTAYVLNSILYMFVSGLYLNEQKTVRNYIFKRWYYCFVLPVYRFMVYWMRMAGILNSLNKDSSWNSATLSEELKQINRSLAASIKPGAAIFLKVKSWINK